MSFEIHSIQSHFFNLFLSENTDAESEAESQIVNSSAELFSGMVEETSSDIMTNRELSSIELRERRLLEKSSLDKVFEEMLAGSGAEDDGDSTITEFSVAGGKPIFVSIARVIIQNQSTSGRRTQDAPSFCRISIPCEEISNCNIFRGGHSRHQYRKCCFIGTLYHICNNFITFPVTKRMRTDKVCHPPEFKETSPSTSRRGKGRKSLANPYAKSAFVWTSDDDDFE